jgi:hypothetical protein
MALKTGLVIAVALIIFLAYVSTRDGHFKYERSGVINAPAEKIYPYISDLNLGGLWSPYQKKDPNMKTKFIGSGKEVGSVMEFDGNNEVGAGHVKILKLELNQSVDVELVMTKPFRAENLIEYRLTPEGAGTRFTWTMSGDGGYMTKLMTALIDCEKMVAGDFELGIANLKTLVESETNRPK